MQQKKNDNQYRQQKHKNTGINWKLNGTELMEDDILYSRANNNRNLLDGGRGGGVDNERN